MNESEKILTEFINDIDVEALAEQGKTLDDVSITLDDKIYLDIKSKLDADGCFKGLKIYV